MKNVELETETIKLSKKYCKKKKIIKIMLEKCMELDYNISDSRKIVIEFLNF